MLKFEKTMFGAKAIKSKPKPRDPKDILRGIVGEIGELRSAVKLEEDVEALRKILREDWEEIEDNINDVYWLAALFANGNGVVLEEVIEKIAERKKEKKQAPNPDLHQ